MVKSVSAFSNCRGGKLIFGVDEDNKIIGLGDYQADSEYISEVIKTKIEAIPDFDMEIKELDGKYILILHIFPGSNTPYFYVDSGSRTAYVRIGNQSVVASRTDLINLSLKGHKSSYDSLPFGKSSEEVSFRELTLEFNERAGQKFETKDLKSFGLVDDKGELTIAGALFADGQQLYQSRVFCTRWNGLSKTNGRLEAMDDKEYEGNLLYLLSVTLDFIKRNNTVMWKKGTLFRREFPDYPARAIQEAIVNALIHRDYAVVGSEVHVDIYDDRMEIFSPGGMYDGTLVQEVDPYNIVSSRRNPVIADLFARMKVMVAV